MAFTIYQKVIYDMIDFEEDVKKKFRNMINSTNEDLIFSQNEDGSMACYIKYKEHNISIRITENEVFQFALQRGKEASRAIEEIIKEKMISELLKEK